MHSSLHGLRSIYSSSYLFVLNFFSVSVSLSLARYITIDDAHDHDIITDPISRRFYDPDHALFRSISQFGLAFHFHSERSVEKLRWRRLISYDIFPFLAVLFARLRARTFCCVEDNGCIHVSRQAIYDAIFVLFSLVAT